jgi:hypothetical protein
VLRGGGGNRVGYQCSVCGVLYLNDQESEAMQCCRPEPSKDLLDTEARASAAEIEVARLRAALDMAGRCVSLGTARRVIREELDASERRYGIGR